MHANEREVYIPRGKVLGGSSAMNFMAWTRPSDAAVEFGAWAKLAKSKAWGWKDLLPYFKKVRSPTTRLHSLTPAQCSLLMAGTFPLSVQSETFHAPGPNNLDTSQLYDKSAHGHHGPVSASYGPYMSTQFSAFFASLVNMGIARATDLTDGGPGGVSWSASSINPSTHQRVTSQTAYCKQTPLFHVTPTSVLIDATCGAVWERSGAHCGVTH